MIDHIDVWPNMAFLKEKKNTHLWQEDRENVQHLELLIKQIKRKKLKLLRK